MRRSRTGAPDPQPRIHAVRDSGAVPGVSRNRSEDPGEVPDLSWQRAAAVCRTHRGHRSSGHRGGLGYLRIPGHGGPGFGGERAGDLFVQVMFEPSDHIRREGTEAYTETTVPLAVPLLGGVATVRTIDGHAELKVPAGTQPDTQFRMRGLGFPRFRGWSGRPGRDRPRRMPRSLSGHEKELLREALGEGTPAVTGRRESFFHRRS